MKRPLPSSVDASLQEGFTIVELMIATAVFSIVILIITYGVLRFTSDYYKGVNTSATQTAAQNVIDTIAQAVQFSRNDGTSVVPPVANGSDAYFCAGSKEFVYTPGVEYMGDEPGGSSGWGFYMLPQTSGACTFPASAAGGTELLSKRMRIANLDVESTSDGFWSMALTVTYGDADLLCNTTLGVSTGGCQPGAPQYAPDHSVILGTSGDAVECKSTVGSQFCAVSNLNTAVGQRIGN